MLRLISQEARGPEQQAMRTAASELDRDWGNLTTSQRKGVFRAASNALRDVGKKVGPNVGRVIGEQSAKIIGGTKDSASQEYQWNISPRLSGLDVRVVDHAAFSAANYITDQYGNRAEEFEQRARNIVAAGLEKGYGAADIAEDLSADLIDAELGRSESYFRMVASVHVTRARTFGLLSSFTDAGISSYSWLTVDDEAVCDICDFMEGREFQTEDALDTWGEVAGSDDPTDVEDLQPWIQSTRDEHGDRVLFASVNGTKHGLARVDRSAEGQKGVSGKFSQAASDAKLQGLGIDSPPVHGNCRCTLEPGETTSVSVPGNLGPEETEEETDKPALVGNLKDYFSSVKDPEIRSPIMRARMTAEDVVAGMTHEGVASWMQENKPALQLTNSESVTKEVERGTMDKQFQTNTSGLYQVKEDGLVHIWMDVRWDEEKSKLPWGETWGVSNKAEDAQDATRDVFVHELGHHLHLWGLLRGAAPTELGSKVDKTIRDAFRSLDVGPKEKARILSKTAPNPAISRYAISNHYEYFAESFSAYVRHHDVLKAHDAIGYKMVRDVLKLLGIE